MSRGPPTREVTGRPRASWRLAGVGLVAAAAALFLVRLGDRAVVSEEVRWAEVAREMRATGDWLHPTVNGATYYDKPAGSYWLIVAASRLTGGVDEATARLPAALAGVAGVWVATLLGRRLYDDRAGLLAGAVLATSFGFAFYARRATADVETVTGVLVAVWLFARREDRPAGPWLVGLWVWMALVSLTKGLLGFALPMAVFLTYGTWAAWAERSPARGFLRAAVDSNRWLFNRWTLAAAPLGIAVYLLPFVSAAERTGSRIALEMVWRENVRRFVAPHNHAGPVYLYLGVILVLAAPWSAFLPAALVPPRPASRGDRLARAYFWAVFVFFTASASRRSYYLLPVLPPVALLIGRVLVAEDGELSGLARRLRIGGWWLSAAGVVLAGAALLPPGRVLPPPYDLLPPLPARGWVEAGWLVSLAAVLIAWRKSSAARAGVAAAVAFAALGYGFGVAYPAADDLRTRRDFLIAVRERTDADPGRLGLFHASDAVFDLGRTAPEFAAPGELSAAVAAGRVRWVLLPRRLAPEARFDAAVVAEEAANPWESREQVDNKLVLLDAGGRR